MRYADTALHETNGSDSAEVYWVQFVDGSGTLSSFACEPNRVYRLLRASEVPADVRLRGWRCKENGKYYDPGVLFFNLAKPGETLTFMSSSSRD